MKALIALATFTALAASVSAFAALGGNWNGTGTLNVSGMPAMACQEVHLNLAETATSLDVQQFTYKCSGMDAEVQPQRFDLRDGHYYLGRKIVGEVHGNVSDLNLVDPNGQGTLTLHFERQGNNLALRSTTSAQGLLTATLHP